MKLKSLEIKLGCLKPLFESEEFLVNKLYKEVCCTDDGDCDIYLTVETAFDEVELSRLELSRYMGCRIYEVTEVDGHKIVVD